MAKLKWDETGEKVYETGAKKGVLYLLGEDKTYSKGYAWNGLTGVTENPSGAEPTPLYANDTKYLQLMSAETYGCTIEAYTYPKEFRECDGSKELTPGVYIGQQDRKPFGFSYVTTKGNDVDGTGYGYIINLVYGGMASPSSKTHSTINESPEAVNFSWEVTTTPVNTTDCKPTASLTIDSTLVDADKLAAFETILYGSESVEARLPLPDEVATLLTAEA